MLHDHWKDPDIVFELWYVIIALSSLFAKIVNLLLNRRKVSSQQCYSLVDFQLSILIKSCFLYCTNLYLRQQIKCICIAMNDHWNILTRKFEVQILKHYSNISRKLTIAYSCEYVALLRKQYIFLGKIIELIT